MHADQGVQGRGWLPRPVTHTPHVFAVAAGSAHGHPATVAGQDVAALGESGRLQLQALHRGVDIARGAKTGGFLPQHMPGLDGPAQLQLDIVELYPAVVGKAELLEGGQPVKVEGVAVGLQVCHHELHVLPDVVRQHKAIVQLGAPAHQGLVVGFFPEARHQGAQQQGLHQRHAAVGRHFKAPEFENAQAAGGAVGGVQLVDAELRAMGVAGDIDQQVAQQPVHQPGLRHLAV